MKIASLFESIKIGGGVENVQANLSIGLEKTGYHFTHLVLDDRLPRNDYKGNIVSLGEKFIFGFGFKKIIALFRLGYKVSKFCKKEKIDVIIGQGDFFYMVVSISKILFGNKSKCIGVVHTTIGIWSNLIKKVLIFLLKRLDKVVLISKEEYNMFLNNYNFKKEKLEFIYNSIDIEKINLLKKEEVTDFDFSKFTFINVGRLTYQKGQDRLIKAFDKLNKIYPEIQLIILGDGELKQDYLDLIKGLGNKNIHLLGNKENVYKYLNYSNCFIMSSNFEGFGLVLVEAMACGLPIISTDCPSGPSEILSGEKDINQLIITNNATLIPYKDKMEDYLYEAMEMLYLDDETRKKLSENNLKRVLDFDVKIIMGKWDELIDNF